MNIKQFIGWGLLIGTLISLAIPSSILGYKIYQGINSADVAIAVKILFIAIFVISLLAIGAGVSFGIYYITMKTTISTIARNMNTNEKTQELSAELARKALETMAKISNDQQSTPVVNLSLPQAKVGDSKKEEEEENVVKLHKWEKG